MFTLMSALGLLPFSSLAHFFREKELKIENYDIVCCRMALHPHGLYYFKTVIPGNEVSVGWGEDPAPHIHYDVICSGCAANAAFSGGSYEWWGKVYPEELCTVDACGMENGKPGSVHQAQEKQTVNSQVVYKYDFVFPRTEGS